ncbi:hypothetical protein GQ53DRAFT_665751 [Thozetella sp. PMI_491]|nr:hypothetical protein GQ53DRAFT_665751 [Thozetella sp. PMI_491]
MDDDPGLSWPFWKFGLKKDDLFTKLHDQYNTFSLAIQDREAFHHDVFEISNEAGTLDEFHHLLAGRKQQRLRELNQSLEAASLEIIANPSLIGTEQWPLALHLFRTKSLDSLVRYFSSYLPDKWNADPVDPYPPAFPVQSNPPVLESLTLDDAYSMMDEPESLSDSTDSTDSKDYMPPSNRTMTMYSDSSAASPADMDHDSYVFDNLTPARSLSFSESEPDHFHLQDSILDSHAQLKESKPCDTEALSASVIDDEDSSQLHLEGTESDQPTPKPIPCSGSSFFDTKPLLPRRRHRSFSPSRPHPLSLTHIPEHDVRQLLHSPRHRRRDGLSRSERTRSPADLTGRIRKPLPDSIRPKPRGRGRVYG